MDDPATSVTSSLWASLNSWFTSTVFFVLLNLMIATIVFTSNLPDTTNNNNNQEQQEQQQDDQKKADRNQPQLARSPSILHRLKSFNFYPQKSQNESLSETHYHQHPLEVAATQYVFNQPLDYQHFDFDSTNPDPVNSATSAAAGNQFSGETPTNGYDSTNPDPIHAGNRFSVETQNRRYDSDDIRTGENINPPFDFETDPNPAGEENEDEFESLDEVYSRLKSGGHDRTKSDGSIPTKAPAKMKKSASLKVGFTHHEEEEIVEARRPATVKAVRVVNDDDDVEVDSKADDFINKFKNDLKLQRIESIMKTRGSGK